RWILRSFPARRSSDLLAITEALTKREEVDGEPTLQSAQRAQPLQQVHRARLAQREGHPAVRVAVLLEARGEQAAVHLIELQDLHHRASNRLTCDSSSARRAGGSSYPNRS